MLPIEGIISLLKLIHKSKKDNFKNHIQNLSNRNLKILSESSYNLLKGVILLSGTPLKKARKFKHLYKTFGKKTNSLSLKRRILLENTEFTKSLLKNIIEAFT